MTLPADFEGVITDLNSLLEKVRASKKSTLESYDDVIREVHSQFLGYKDVVTNFKREFLKRAIRKRLQKEVESMKNPLEGLKLQGNKMKVLIKGLRDGLGSKP